MGLDKNERDAMHGYGSTVVVGGAEKSNTTLSIAKVFLYMFIGILITAVVAAGVGILLNGLYQSDKSAYNNTIMGIMIGTAIALLIDVVIINFVTLKGNHTILVPGIIYCILVGLLFSTFILFIDPRIIGLAFGITCGVFLLMSLIGFLTKGNMSPLLIAAIGLFIGTGFIALFNWIYQLASGTGFNALNWIISFAIFAVLILVTIYDLWNIKKIAERGAMSRDITLYCAFSLYVDFINIFLRILYYLIIIFGRRN